VKYPGTVRVLLSAAVFALGAASPSFAQSRPLVTEDPETVPVGFVLIEGGIDFLSAVPFPASGLKGDVLRIGTFGLNIGVGPITELQIDGGLRRRLNISTVDPAAPLAGLYTGTGSTTSGLDDLFIGAKVRFLSEAPGRPALALRFATRLPNASTESGLGTGTTDVHFALAAAKTVESIRVAANLGIAVLGDPVNATDPNTVMTYGLSVARAVASGIELVGDLNGRLNTGETPTPSTESRGSLRLGGRLTRGPVRLDAAFLIGVTDADPSFGLSTGFTWVFKAFGTK
jgi:hypothetical protein